jgi:lipopolysaccharide transport system ATP-binding protein
MSDVVIQSEGLGKSYTISHQHRERYTALRDVLTNRVKNAWSRIRNPHCYDHDTVEDFWALKNASFEVKQGDRIGIIGRNGAGKSTLLKILSRITEPTTGRVEITGRVASLLEVGTGFHPELTGRENIFLNGAILGMSQAEIKKKFDEIVAFAEVEQFLDTPVKRYSSGMYVRLAFAVAAHLESEILLVDEVLAVGDAAFQKKCMGKMQDVSTQNDRTILFVSHNMTAIQSLCNKGILLTKGGIQKMGEIGSVTNEYFSSYFHSQLRNEWDRETAPGNETIRVKKVHILPESDDSTIDVTTPLKVVAEFWICQENITVNRLSLALKNIKGEYIFACITECSCTKGLHKAAVQIPGNFLNDDTYTIDFYFLNGAHVFFLHQDCLVFQVNDIPRPSTAYLGKWVGAVRPTLHWECCRLADV